MFWLVTLDEFLKPSGRTESPDDVEGEGTLREGALKILLPIDEIIKLEGEAGKKAAGYARVSTTRQASRGESLPAQREELIDLAKRRGISTLYLFAEAKTGKNFNRRKLDAILYLARIGEISELLVRDIDRVGRKGLEIVGFIIQLRSYNVVTVTLEKELDVKEMQDMFYACFKSCRAEEENKRRRNDSLSSKVLNFKNRRWNLPLPIGYRKNGEWIEKVEDYTPLLTDVFKLFLELKDYTAVAKTVNLRYGDLLSKPLSPERVAAILTNPVYVGRPKFGSQNVEVEDLSLAFIEAEVFRKVQEIIERKKSEYERKVKPIDRLVGILGYDILPCFDNVAPFCPLCKQAMTLNGQSYVCKKDGVQRRLIKRSELERVAEWILKREEALKTFKEVLKTTKNVDQVLRKFKGMQDILTSYM
jgi:DNA invertase Pin-like site-specific DNA recombinase